MAKVLSIVESAYRATTEEQDDTILWLNHIMSNNGLDVTLLLRSNAVNYVVEGQSPPKLTIGGVEAAQPPALDKDVSEIIDKGVPVYYVAEDVKDRGIDSKRLIDGAKAVSRSELPGLLDGFDHVWHW